MEIGDSGDPRDRGHDRQGLGAIGKLSASIRFVDAMLTTERIRRYPIFMLIVGVAFYVVAVAAGHSPFDTFGHPYAIDLSNRITAGRMVLDGNVDQLYDVQSQRTIQQSILGGQHPEFLDVFISPPFAALLYAPLAALPYVVSAAIWSTLAIVLLIVDLRLIWPIVPELHRHGLRVVLIAVLSSWPVIELLTDGQDAAVSLLLLVGGLRLLLTRRDLLAGGVLGLGVFKPQLFLLIPILLLLQRRWRALAGWLAVALTLTAFSVAIVGPDGARSYLALLTSPLLRSGLGSLNWKMQSISALTQAIFAGPVGFLAMPITLLVDAALIATFVRLAHRSCSTRSEFLLLYGLTVLVGAIVSPYLFIYDCVILVLPALILLNEAPPDRVVRVSIAAAYVLTWTASLRFIVFGHLSWPLPLLAAPWTVLALVSLAWAGFHMGDPGRGSNSEWKPGNTTLMSDQESLHHEC